MITQWYSLKKNLLFLLLGGTTLIWLVSAILTYYDIHHEIDELVSQGYLFVDKYDDDNDKKLLENENITFNKEEVKELKSELVEHLVWRMLAPALFGLPIIALWILIVLNIKLKPLQAITRDIELRNNDDLHGIYPKNAPLEIKPLISALNHLFNKVEIILENERRFTDNAAHEMRTPLAGLYTQLQVAMRAREQNEKDRAISLAFKASQNIKHLLEQLLTFSRLQPNEDNLGITKINIAEIIDKLINEHNNAVLEKKIKIHWERKDLVININLFALEILLRNILDNAIRYGNESGNIDVELESDHKNWQITISDDGPGLSEQNMQLATSRFSRFAGQETEGCGLGLSIAERCAKILAGNLTLSSKNTGESGLVVTFQGKLDT